MFGCVGNKMSLIELIILTLSLRIGAMQYRTKLSLMNRKKVRKNRRRKIWLKQWTIVVAMCSTGKRWCLCLILINSLPYYDSGEISFRERKDISFLLLFRRWFTLDQLRPVTTWKSDEKLWNSNQLIVTHAQMNSTKLFNYAFLSEK